MCGRACVWNCQTALELSVSAFDTLREVKMRITDLEGTPTEWQRLIFNGLNLPDDRTMSSLKINHGAVFLLVPKIIGEQKKTKTIFGCPEISYPFTESRS